MIWAAIATVVGGVVLNLLANEIGDVAPWLARRILRRASRWEAAGSAEGDLIFEEQCELLEAIPGRLTKLVWAAGRLRFGLRLTFAPGRHRIGRISGPACFELVTALLMYAGLLSLILSPPTHVDSWFERITVIAGYLSLSSVAVSLTAAVALRWQHHKEPRVGASPAPGTGR